MAILSENVQETIRIHKNIVTMKVVVIMGKDGDYFVALAPSVNVSGYGKTKEEARQSFGENAETFLLDIMSLDKLQRDKELSKMGFRKEVFKNKNYSKVYIDENGELQNFEGGIN